MGSCIKNKKCSCKKELCYNDSDIININFYESKEEDKKNKENDFYKVLSITKENSSKNIIKTKSSNEMSRVSSLLTNTNNPSLNRKKKTMRHSQSSKNCTKRVHLINYPQRQKYEDQFKNCLIAYKNKNLIKPKPKSSFNKNVISIGVFGSSKSGKRTLVNYFCKGQINNKRNLQIEGIEKMSTKITMKEKSYELKFTVFHNFNLYNENAYSFNIIFLIYKNEDESSSLFAQNIINNTFGNCMHKILLFVNNINPSEKEKEINPIKDQSDLFYDFYIKYKENIFMFPFKEEEFLNITNEIINLRDPFY